MGMPAPAYRLMFGKAGVKSMEQGILALAGFSPVKDTLIGLVDGASEKTRAGWLEKMRALGEGAR
jgi:putative NADPH-quinone reductase